MVLQQLQPQQQVLQPVTDVTQSEPIFSIQLPSLPPLMQSAYAVSSFTFNDNLVNDCEESPGNDDFIGTCTNDISEPVHPTTQVPPTGTSNQYDATINVDALNDCDEFDAGVNNADCLNDADYVLGPVTQTNDPSVNPVSTNEVDYVTDDFLLNGCDEAGNGDNNAFCHNTLSNAFDSIDQLNEIDSTSVGVNFVASNTVDILQGSSLNNDCDEEGSGNNGVDCDNDLDNFIGPVDQTNIVTNTPNPNAIHTNNIEVSQTGSQFNPCDESGSGSGANFAHCDSDADNEVFGVDQDNFADGPNNAAQTNDFTVDQSSDL